MGCLEAELGCRACAVGPVRPRPVSPGWGFTGLSGGAEARAVRVSSEPRAGPGADGGRPALLGTCGTGTRGPALLESGARDTCSLGRGAAASVEERGCWALGGNSLLKRLIRPFLSYLRAPHRAWWVRSGSRTCLAPSSERGPIPSPPFPQRPHPMSSPRVVVSERPLVRALPHGHPAGVRVLLCGEKRQRTGMGALGVRPAQAKGWGPQLGCDSRCRGQRVATGLCESSPKAPLPCARSPEDSPLHTGGIVCALCNRCQAVCEGQGPGVLCSLCSAEAARCHHRPPSLC